jgi:response regulator RpfG family c-di-GMP phosphodiesterase
MVKAKGILLLVDDELSILNALKRIFIAQGYTVHTADNGLGGIAVLEQQPSIDIIISDMRMPGMSGAEFLKIAADRWPNTKRILLTGYADINSAISAINEGRINYYISKPWKNDELVSIINNALDNKRLRDQNHELQQLLSQQNEELKTLNNNLEEKVKERSVELYKSYNELQETHAAAVQVFLSMQELHEGRYKGYCRGVATQAKLLAQAMNLGEKEVQSIYLAAMLHNLGKNGLPATIMSKPFNQLTLKEHKAFIQYPILGSTVLSAFPSLKEVANIILHHRERFDGHGYPHGLKDYKIPFGARILSIVVDYNELQYGLIDPNKYHAKLALKYIHDHFERYDPKILSAFMDTIVALPDEQFSLTEEVYTSDQLKPGMILSRELVSKNGFVFLIKGYQLTSEVIDKIKLLDNIVVYVHKNPEQD